MGKFERGDGGFEGGESMPGKVDKDDEDDGPMYLVCLAYAWAWGGTKEALYYTWKREEGGEPGNMGGRGRGFARCDDDGRREGRRRR